jgi:elongation factor Ts
MVRDLRERTGAGMMDCKRALAEAGGDMDKATDVLRRKGLAAAAKKSSRIASEGVVAAHVDAAAGSLVEINCETDFVAKTDELQAFAKEIAFLVHAKGPASVEEALALPMGDGTLSDMLTGKVARIGEKVSFRRFTRFALPAGEKGVIASYIHAGGKIGVLVEIRGAGGDASESAALAKDLAMQVAAANPSYVAREEIPPETIDREKAVYREQALAAGKPEKVVDRIAEGKLEKYYTEVCLIDQDFIKDPDRKVKDLLGATSARAGTEFRVSRFVRFQVGEGMEKRSSDLAAEVAKQIGRT